MAQRSPGKRGKNAELSTGERLTKRDLIRPEQVYLCKTCVKTEHTGDYERVGIFILGSPKDLGRLCEMAPVRIVS